MINALIAIANALIDFFIINAKPITMLKKKSWGEIGDWNKY